MSPFDDHEMALTRRRLLALGGGATVALYAGSLPALALAAPVPASLRRSAYTPLVGSSFDAVAPGGGSETLTLAAVGDLVRARSDPTFVGRDDAFALSFTGPSGAVLDSAVHTLSNATLGSVSLFISPVDQPDGDQTYEVVVDRSVTLAGAQQDAPLPLELSNAAAAPTAPPTPPVAHPAGKPAAIPLVTTTGVARRGKKLTADVRVARGHDIVAVRATLIRGGVRYATGSIRLRGRAGVRLTLRRTHRVAAGTYELRLTTTDGRGRHVVSTVHVVVR
jgi:hypothetical protein